MTRWQDLTGGDGGDAYVRRMDEHMAKGDGVHGEADLCEWLLPGGGSILDAGCGTGRVAIELSRRGYDCVGVDLDESMLSVARSRGSDVEWVLADLSTLDLGRSFDLALCAGNVIPLLEAGTESAATRSIADHLDPGGLLVCGFGLDVAHLPLDEAPVTLNEYDTWCESVGLELVDRWATWERAPFDGGGYHVSVHRRADQPVDTAR